MIRFYNHWQRPVAVEALTLKLVRMRDLRPYVQVGLLNFGVIITFGKIIEGWVQHYNRTHRDSL